jgi:hypothetical protein
MVDPRTELYEALHRDQLTPHEARNARCAARILDIVLSHYRPASALDVGCGLGTWLRTLRARGVTDLEGVEGPWLDAGLATDPDLPIQKLDLENGFELGRRFELAICIEVAEHLSSAAAASFVASLLRHAPVVLFSAAVPHQGGHHHVNEQYLPYWLDLFGRAGARPLDVIRPQIWDEPDMFVWLRQNLVLFATDAALAAHPRLTAALQAARQPPPSMIHPDLYAARIAALDRQLSESRALRAMLGTGGRFAVDVGADGALTIRRTER